MSLTPRQREVAELVARGCSNKAIAQELDISINTVEVHIENAAARIDYPGRPRHKLTLFILRPDADNDSAA